MVPINDLDIDIETTKTEVIRDGRKGHIKHLSNPVKLLKLSNNCH